MKAGENQWMDFSGRCSHVRKITEARMESRMEGANAFDRHRDACGADRRAYLCNAHLEQRLGGTSHVRGHADHDVFLWSERSQYRDYHLFRSAVLQEHVYG